MNFASFQYSRCRRGDYTATGSPRVHDLRHRLFPVSVSATIPHAFFIFSDHVTSACFHGSGQKLVLRQGKVGWNYEDQGVARDSRLRLVRLGKTAVNNEELPFPFDRTLAVLLI